MDLATSVGLVATFFSIISFIPQVIKAWQTKRTKDLSLHAFFLLETGTIIWLSYGILIKSVPVIISNSIISLLVLCILILKRRYK